VKKRTMGKQSLGLIKKRRKSRARNVRRRPGKKDGIKCHGEGGAKKHLTSRTDEKSSYVTVGDGVRTEKVRQSNSGQLGEKSIPLRKYRQGPLGAAGGQKGRICSKGNK